MTRPLMQLGIVELEQLFARASADPSSLGKLNHELKFRQVPRAVALLEKVETAVAAAKGVQRQPADLLSSVPAQPRPPASLPVQLLAIEPPVVITPAQLELMSSTSPAAEAVVTTTSVPVKPKAGPSPNASGSVHTEEEALQALALQKGATWESIEHSRRYLVDLAHPARLAQLDEQRRETAVQASARANAAARVLMQSKSYW